MNRSTTELPPEIRELLARGDGVIDVAAAAAAGVSNARLTALTGAGRLIRLAEGCYAERAAYERANRWEQFRLRSVAFVASCGPYTFLVGLSSAVVWELPTLGPPPSTPDVIRPKGRGSGPSTSTTGRTRVARLPLEQVLLYGKRGRRQIPIMSPAWTVADLARDLPVVDGLVMADTALRNGEPVLDMATHFTGWDGAPRMRFVLEHADPRAETPIETLGRFTCIEFNIPMPVPNAWVGRDRPERRVDGLWPWHWRTRATAHGSTTTVRTQRTW